MSRRFIRVDVSKLNQEASIVVEIENNRSKASTVVEGGEKLGITIFFPAKAIPDFLSDVFQLGAIPVNKILVFRLSPKVSFLQISFPVPPKNYETFKW